MADRKNYSIRREAALYSIIHDALIQIRIDILKGKYSLYDANKIEEKLCKDTLMLGDQVCAEYRKSYASNRTQA